jgi:hypothetical protein
MGGPACWAVGCYAGCMFRLVKDPPCMLCDGLAEIQLYVTCHAARGSEHLLACSWQAGISLNLPTSTTAVVGVEARSIGQQQSHLNGVRTPETTDVDYKWKRKSPRSPLVSKYC